MDADSNKTNGSAQGPCWDEIFNQVNAWRGACMHHVSVAEMAVTETLLTLSNATPDGTRIRLRHLIGQRLDDLIAALSQGAPFEEVGKTALVELSQYRKEHEAFRNSLCHGVVKVTVDRGGKWVLVLRQLSIRSRPEERNTLILDQSEAQAKLDILKRDVRRFVSVIGQLRKAVTS